METIAVSPEDTTSLLAVLVVSKLLNIDVNKK